MLEYTDGALLFRYKGSNVRTCTEHNPDYLYVDYCSTISTYMLAHIN